MSSKTVFVIGAGAGVDLKMPTGEKLKDQISRLLNFNIDPFNKVVNGDKFIFEAIKLHMLKKREHPQIINSFLEKALFIKSNLSIAKSIDNFIDTHRGCEKIELCGKLAIVRSILEAEKSSVLYDVSRAFSISEFVKKRTWLNLLFQIFTENCTKDDLKERLKSITLIIFNYDRCIEKFLFNSIRQYYNITDYETSDILSNITIYHPYGKVGVLPWDKSGNNIVIKYGETPSPSILLELSNHINTFTEGTDPDTSEITEIRNHMALANKVIYLGFAFHKLNVNLIKPNLEIREEEIYTDSFGSALGISVDDQMTIKSELAEIYNLSESYVQLMHASCIDFLSNYMRSLSF